MKILPSRWRSDSRFFHPLVLSSKFSDLCISFFNLCFILLSLPPLIRKRHLPWFLSSGICASARLHARPWPSSTTFLSSCCGWLYRNRPANSCWLHIRTFHLHTPYISQGHRVPPSRPKSEAVLRKLFFKSRCQFLGDCPLDYPAHHCWYS